MKLRHLISLFALAALSAVTSHAQLTVFAVDPTTYAPAFPSGATTFQLAVNKDTGALLVQVVSGGGGSGGGDASAANQTSEITQLTGINGKLGPVSADPGFTSFRTTALTSTAQAIKASGGNLYSVTLYNVNTVPVYVKFYNTAAGSVTVGTTAITHVIIVPPGDGTTPGAVIMPAGLVTMKYFSTAIAAACVTGLADNSTTAPSTAIYAEAEYK